MKSEEMTTATIDPHDWCKFQMDDLRMMLLGMVNDPRVVLIKLADRLHNMRTMYFF